MLKQVTEKYSGGIITRNKCQICKKLIKVSQIKILLYKTNQKLLKQKYYHYGCIDKKIKNKL